MLVTFPISCSIRPPRVVVVVLLAHRGVTNAQDELQSYVFRGQEDVDWANQFTAPLDTRRITVKSDRTRTIRPGNDTGASRVFNLWYPIRRTISYEDDMEAIKLVIVHSPLWVYVVLVTCMSWISWVSLLVTGSSLTTYKFSPEGSFYWHER